MKINEKCSITGHVLCVRAPPDLLLVFSDSNAEKRELNKKKTRSRNNSLIFQHAARNYQASEREWAEKKAPIIKKRNETNHPIEKNVAMWRSLCLSLAHTYIKASNSSNTKTIETKGILFFSLQLLCFFAIEYFMNWTNCYTIFRRFRSDLYVNVKSQFGLLGTLLMLLLLPLLGYQM